MSKRVIGAVAGAGALMTVGATAALVAQAAPSAPAAAPANTTQVVAGTLSPAKFQARCCRPTSRRRRLTPLRWPVSSRHSSRPTPPLRPPLPSRLLRLPPPR